MKNSYVEDHYYLEGKKAFDLGLKASFFLPFYFHGFEALIAKVDCRLAKDDLKEELNISYCSLVKKVSCFLLASEEDSIFIIHFLLALKVISFNLATAIVLAA